MWEEGLTEEVGLVGGAEAEGGNGPLVAPDEPAAEAGLHVQQPDQPTQARSRQHVPALLVAGLCDHRQGGPGHREELLERGGEQSLRGRATSEPRSSTKDKGGRVWPRDLNTSAPRSQGSAHHPAGARRWHSPHQAPCTCVVQCPSGSRSHTRPPHHTWPRSATQPLPALFGRSVW